MNKYIAAAAALTCIVSQSDACPAGQRNYFSYGPGLVTCREFVRDMKRDGTQITELFFRSWALGFASGLSHGGELREPEAILPYRDVLMQRVMDACATRGDWYFGTALEAVIDQITPVGRTE